MDGISGPMRHSQMHDDCILHKPHHTQMICLLRLVFVHRVRP